MAVGDALPVEVPPPPSPRKYWTRRGIAEWLVEQLAEDAPTLVGIDHGFSFPLRYFASHGLKPDWPAFLDDFQRHWPTDEDIYVDFVRDGTIGNGAARVGNPRWRRLTEERAGAKSVFHFESWRMGLRGFATWGSENYNSYYFGVSTVQAQDSGLSRYNADAGFQQVGLLGVFDYDITQSWKLSLIGRYGRMIGEVKDSPLVDGDEARGSANQFLGGVIASYAW